MPTYISLLRGINISGQKLIKMNELRSCFETMRYKNVRTYIQSGNVLFDSMITDRTKLAKNIESGLRKHLGHKISVFIRTAPEIAKIVNADPFRKVTTHEESKMFVTFVNEPIKPKPNVPFWSDKKDVEVLAVSKGEYFSLSHPVKGRYGFPNLFVEKTFKVAATTRNWRTVKKLLDIAQSKSS